MKIDWTKFPGGIPAVERSLRGYVEQGCPTGGFLRNVLENQLFGAFATADNESASRMRGILMFIWNELPAECFGTRQNVENWMKRRGLNGGGSE